MERVWAFGFWGPTSAQRRGATLGCRAELYESFKVPLTHLAAWTATIERGTKFPRRTEANWALALSDLELIRKAD